MSNWKRKFIVDGNQYFISICGATGGYKIQILDENNHVILPIVLSTPSRENYLNNRGNFKSLPDNILQKILLFFEEQRIGPILEDEIENITMLIEDFLSRPSAWEHNEAIPFCE